MMGSGGVAISLGEESLLPPRSFQTSVRAGLASALRQLRPLRRWRNWEERGGEKARGGSKAADAGSRLDNPRIEGGGKASASPLAPRDHDGGRKTGYWRMCDVSHARRGKKKKARPLH